MVVIGKGGCIPARWVYSVKIGCIRARWFYSGKSGCIRVKEVIFAKTCGCVWAKVDVFGQWWLYSGKVVIFLQSGCIRAKVVVYGQNGCIREKSGCIQSKEILLGQSGCIRAKVVVFLQSGCTRAIWFYLGKSGCIRAKVVVFAPSGCICTYIMADWSFQRLSVCFILFLTLILILEPSKSSNKISNARSSLVVALKVDKRNYPGRNSSGCS